MHWWLRGATQAFVHKCGQRAAWAALPQHVTCVLAAWPGVPVYVFPTASPSETSWLAYNMAGHIVQRCRRIKQVSLCCPLKKNKRDRWDNAPTHQREKEKNQKRGWQRKGRGRKTAHFLLSWKQGLLLTPGWICRCWSQRVKDASAGCCFHGDLQRQERQKTARDDGFWIKNRVFLPFAPHHPIPAGFCSSQAVGVRSFDGKGEAALCLSHGLVISKPFTTQQNKYGFFCLTLGPQKKKRQKKKTAAWNCSSHPQNSPPPWSLKGSIIILIWTIAFISSGCVEVGERWISYFSLCHQKWVCGAGASWKSGTCLFPSGVFVGRGGRKVEQRVFILHLFFNFILDFQIF